jgi:hypothetical protein
VCNGRETDVKLATYCVPNDVYNFNHACVSTISQLP